MSAVDRWMKVLLPTIKPLIYANGGLIIAVQVAHKYYCLYYYFKQYVGVSFYVLKPKTEMKAETKARRVRLAFLVHRAFAYDRLKYAINYACSFRVF